MVRILITLCTMVWFSGCQMNNDLPNHVNDIQSKTAALSVNKQGYWEAVIGEDHTLVYIPEGEFIMGSDSGEEDELPVRPVYLDSYWIGKYTVTYAQFKRFIYETGYMTDAEQGKGSYLTADDIRGPNPEGNWNNNIFMQGDDHPVISVSWYDAEKYCEWLSEKIDLDFMLPTEAQWEKSARGTDGRAFPWGNEDVTADRANFADMIFAEKYGEERRGHYDLNDGFAETSPVGSFPGGASPYGVMDMAGNVWEWCYDYYDPDYYSVSPDINPFGPNAGGDRVNRGGSYDNWSGYASPERGHNLRSAERTGNEPDSSDDHMGFRIAIDYIERT